MFDYIILIITIIWLLIATISDIKTKEVPNWITYSLVIIALAIYSFKSIHYHTFKPILTSLIGLVVFSILGTLMYYSKQWGGGDTKLLFGLGAALPDYPLILNDILTPNLNIPFLSILYLNILLIGSIYGLIRVIQVKIYNRSSDNSIVFVPAIFLATIFSLIFGNILF